MTTPLIEALQSVCVASGAGPDVTRAVLRAARGDKLPADATLKTREAARILECHPKSVLRYARRGLLHPIRRSPRALRWRKSEIEALAFKGAE